MVIRGCRPSRVGLLFAGLTLLLTAEPSLAAVAVPPATAEALTYHRDLDWLWLADQLFALGIPLLLLFSGLGARLCRWCSRITGGRWFWTLALFAALYLAVTWVLSFPLDFAENFLHQHAFGLSNQSFGRWLQNELVGLAVNSVMAGLTLWLPYLLLQRSPRRWWLWSTVGLAPLFVVLVVLQPIWISPLFNHFGPLDDKALETSILAEAARGGITEAPVFVMDQSSDSKRPGAYVAGLLGTTRIVLFDTLVQDMTPDEVLFVVGHEMKHYLLGDVWKLVGGFLAVLLVGLLVIDRLGRAAIRRWSGAFGFDRLDDPASLPLLGVLFTLVLLVATPGLNLISQGIEHEADRFGLELAQNNDAAANAFVKLQAEALGVPEPGWLERVFRMDHPALKDRIDFANRYHPWIDGQKLIYGDWIKR
jgi:STE24 endopeptidase